MSFFAEYAAILHQNTPQKNENLYGSNSKFRFNLSALIAQKPKFVIFDIYDTLINFRPQIFKSEDEKAGYQRDVFLKTAKEFGLIETLEKIDPNTSAQTTLANFYGGLLIMLDEKDKKNGRNFAEPQVNDVWNLIISMAARNGYDPSCYGIKNRDDLAKCMAYFFHFFSFGRTSLFGGLKEVFDELKSKEIPMGLLSNTQFYTSVELSLLLREAQVCDDYLDIFDDEFCFFSYDFKMSKQSRVLHQKLFDRLYDIDILPKDVCVVSANAWDLDYAEQIGMRTLKAN